MSQKNTPALGFTISQVWQSLDIHLGIGCVILYSLMAFVIGASVCSGDLLPWQGADGKWGFVDTGQCGIIAPQFEGVWGVSQGLALIDLGNKSGFANRVQKLVIASQIDDAWRFTEGLARVQIGDKYGFIDQTGAMVIAPQFDAPFGAKPRFQNGGARAGQDGKAIWIGTTGRVLGNPVCKKLPKGSFIPLVFRSICAIKGVSDGYQHSSA
jgi:hypothetical protein